MRDGGKEKKLEKWQTGSGGLERQGPREGREGLMGTTEFLGRRSLREASWWEGGLQGALQILGPIETPGHHVTLAANTG